jgi:hypothetical protein
MKIKMTMETKWKNRENIARKQGKKEGREGKTRTSRKQKKGTGKRV